MYLTSSFTILENHDRGVESDVTETETDEEKWQLLIVVDGLAGHLSYENARVIFMPHTEGYHHLAQKLNNGTYSVRGYKIVVLLIGRGEVWDTDRRYFARVEATIQAVKNQDEQCILVLGATLPLTADSRPMVNSLHIQE